jgi:hypothetical protein
VKELFWIFPLAVAISFVLGGCRAETGRRILSESARTFGRIVVAMVVIALVLQVVLWAIPRTF